MHPQDTAPTKKTNEDYFSQFEDAPDDYWSQFEDITPKPTPKPAPPQKGWIDTGLDYAQWGAQKAGEFLEGHPNIRRLFFGQTPEELVETGKRVGVVAPEKLKATDTSFRIPAITRYGESLEQRGFQEANPNLARLGGFIAGSGEGLVAGALDPGNAGIKGVPRGPRTVPIPRRAPTKALPPAGQSTRTFYGGREGLSEDILGTIDVKPTKVETVFTKPTEVTSEIPKTKPIISERAKSIDELLKETKTAHGVFERESGIPDKDWVDWYANYMSKKSGIPEEQLKPLLKEAGDTIPTTETWTTDYANFIDKKLGKGRDISAKEYIDGIKAGTIPRDMTFAEFKKQGPEASRFTEKSVTETPEGGVRIRPGKPTAEESADTFIEELVNNEFPRIERMGQNEELIRFAIESGGTPDPKFFNALRDDQFTLLGRFVDKFGPDFMAEFKKYSNRLPTGPEKSAYRPSADDSFAYKIGSVTSDYDAFRQAMRRKLGPGFDQIPEIEVRKVYDNITKAMKAVNMEAKELSSLQPYATPSGKSFYVYDPGQRMNPVELSNLVHNPAVQEVGTIINEAVDHAKISAFRNIFDKQLKKAGIALHKGLRGVTLMDGPAHGYNNAGVFVNPLQMMTFNSPDQAAAGITHTILHELTHIVKRGHNEDFTIALAEIYEKFGAQKYNEVQERILNAITGGTKTKYTPEISDLLLRYKEIAGRPATIENAIDSAAISGGLADRGSAEFARYSKPSGRNTNRPIGPERASQRLVDALRAAGPMRNAQEAIYSAERSARFRAFQGVTAKGQKGANIRMGKLAGEMEKVQTSPLQLAQKDTDELFDQVAFNKYITPGEKARGIVALRKLLSGGPVLQRGELTVLDKVFGGGFGNQIIQMQGGLGLTGVRLAKVANTMKSMMATLDISPFFRQGLGMVHKKEWRQALFDSLKMGMSHDEFMAAQKALEERPYHLIGRENGLFLAGEELSAREEQFLESYLGDLSRLGGELSQSGNLGARVVGKGINAAMFPFKASERVYVGFLNQVRANVFDNLLESAVAAGHDPDTIAKPLAKFVNTSTGRGDLGMAGKYADALNLAFFSPRLIASRLTMLNPMYYFDPKTPWLVRKEALKSLFAIAGFVGLANGIGSAMGGKLTFDPRNSDFLKVKVGNRTRLDPAGGFSQYIVAASKFLTGKTISPTSGNERTLGQGYGTPSRLSMMFGIGNREKSFMENKLSPALSLADALLSGWDYNMQPVEWQSAVRDRFRPILLQDIQQLMESDPELFPLVLPAAMGMGLQTFEPRQPTMTMQGPGLGNLRP